ncbi:hypothetical protein HQ533_01260 [Candidatus Woesearchaeota archaeon]|nr:hypothetical protein [Candidatus Woesearchaeota archaeon]
MAGNDIKSVSAKLTLQDIPINRILVRRVSKNNDTSGKLTVPRELVDREVFILIPK